MRNRSLAILFVANALLMMSVPNSSAADTVPSGTGTVTFVDGVKTEAEILFVHPNVPRLVVRSPRYSTVQSFDLGVVQSVTVGGKAKQFNKPRKLTDAEATRRQRNALWADEVGPGQIGKYAKETWEARPVFVWRNPGKSGNAMQADSWLDETGKACSELPWNQDEEVTHQRAKDIKAAIDGDILLPAAETEYAAIQPGNRDHLKGIALRHLTVEANGSYQIRYTVTGNLWVKDGAKLGKGTQDGGFGGGDANKHTFARFCNYHEFPSADWEGPRWPYAPSISHWVFIDTGEKGSLEVIGLSGGAGDRLTVMRGELIVGEDCYIGNGNRGSFYNMKGTKVILLDGARIGCPDPLMSGSGGKMMGTYGISGTLMFGTPDRPLTRDLSFGGCYYKNDLVTPDARASQRSHGATFVLSESGAMVVHSADPTKARVIFKPRSKDLPVSQYTLDRSLWKYTVRRGKTGFPPKPELWEHVTDRTGVAAVFKGQTDFNGVVFDGFYKGGIIVDPNARKQWKNVNFGDQNHGTPEELFKAP